MDRIDIIDRVDRVKQIEKVQKEGLELFKKKNKDYGDAFANYGPIGVLIRMGDKISRLQSISKTNITLVEDEKIRDTLIDLHNYSAMAIMLLDENQTENQTKNKTENQTKNQNTSTQVIEVERNIDQDLLIKYINEGYVVRFPP